jgi:hypothetical protein
MKATGIAIVTLQIKGDKLMLNYPMHSMYACFPHFFNFADVRVLASPYA